MHKKILKHLKLQMSVFGTCIRALRLLFPLHIALKFALSTIPLAVIYVFSILLKLLSASTIDIKKTVLYAILFVVLTAIGKALEMLNGILESKINRMMYVYPPLISKRVICRHSFGHEST